jgi:hypothetical protein
VLLARIDHLDWCDIRLPCDWFDNTDAKLSEEPIEANEPKDPMLPTDRNEPTLPMESTDPAEAMDRTESLEAIDQRLAGIRGT